MTQDTSRDFLSGSGETADRKKFQLFMEVGQTSHTCLTAVAYSAVRTCGGKQWFADLRNSSRPKILQGNSKPGVLQATSLAKIMEELGQAEVSIGQQADVLEVPLLLMATRHETKFPPAA